MVEHGYSYDQAFFYPLQRQGEIPNGCGYGGRLFLLSLQKVRVALTDGERENMTFPPGWAARGRQPVPDSLKAFGASVDFITEF